MFFQIMRSRSPIRLCQARHQEDGDEEEDGKEEGKQQDERSGRFLVPANLLVIPVDQPAGTVARLENGRPLSLQDSAKSCSANFFAADGEERSSRCRHKLKGNDVSSVI